MDSLINSTVADAIKKDSSAFVIANIYWFVGSYNSSHGDYASHKNHFEIYVLFSDNNKFYTQKIDNFSYFKKRKTKRKKIEDFLTKSFYEMKNEKLTRKADTTYDDKGNQIITSTITDHEPVRDIRVYKGSDTLQYTYPASFSTNKSNLQTRKAIFLQVLDEAKDNYNKKRQKRISVVWGKESME